ncbi:MAG: endopeptidase La [Armatimonadota bacterium]
MRRLRQPKNRVDTEENNRVPEFLPLLPIRDRVYFPHMIFPLNVGREKSIRALEEARAQDRIILLVSQRDALIDDPEPQDLYEVGIAAEVMHVLNIPDGTVRVMLEGLCRVRILQFLQTDPFMMTRVEVLEEPEENDLETEALMRVVRSQFQQIVELGRNIAPEAVINVTHVDDPGQLADMIPPYLVPVKIPVHQDLLETLSPRERLQKLSIHLQQELEVLELQRTIREKVEQEMGETQKEYFLREQLKTIQQELGERDERTTEVEEYRAKIAESGMPEDVAERARKEVDRLEKMPFAAPEGVVIRTYLDWLVGMPWNKRADEHLEIEDARRVLDEDHYGLAKVKDRVLEFLAVRKLTGTIRGPILCFVGPPGVGKTSIGKSIARALGRKFIRVSLGGVRDEAEIRGHRRTYVGAMPGRIIQGIKQCGSCNPVFMLDEIDKLGADFRGDPSAALLEALDPEQNSSFSDHYLEVPFDLSNVMFITTANILDTVPPALRDRMEVISFPGYTEDEKLEIAKQFLIPKQRREHGLTEEQISIQDEAVLRIIREYTRESGVRNLEREIANICRKVARKVAEGVSEPTVITPSDLEAFLGRPKYHYGVAEEKDEIGAATGLTWSEYGGDVVTVEVALLPGTEGRLQLTGQLGDVMKESAQAALTYCRSRAKKLGIEEDFYSRMEIHIHVPAGAIPKDGPSAGITMATALASALTRTPVRRDVAMTGEITLRGKVLPVGGVKEKVLAAHRAGIKQVILPKENEKDLDEIPPHARRELDFKLVEHMDQVLEIALISGGQTASGGSAPTTRQRRTATGKAAN